MNNALPGWLRVILFVPAFFACYVLASLSFSGIMNTWTQLPVIELFKEINKGNVFYFAAYKAIVFVFSLGCVFIFQYYITQRAFINLGFHRLNYSMHFIRGFLAGLIINLFLFLVLLSAGSLAVSHYEFSTKYLFGSIIVTLLVSFVEEITMRGYVLNSLMDSFNKYTALVVTALLFSLFHVANPNFSLIGFINIFLAGCLLGIGYIFNKSLWFPIGLHFSWNFFLGPVFGFEISGLTYKGVINHSLTGPGWLTGGSFGAEGSVFLTLLLLGLIFFFHEKFRKEAEKLKNCQF